MNGPGNRLSSILTLEVTQLELLREHKETLATNTTFLNEPTWGVGVVKWVWLAIAITSLYSNNYVSMLLRKL